MTLKEIEDKVYKSPEYNFLRSDARLNINICLLTLGGSHAYGTNVETSDLDVRGIAVNSAREILLGRDFEQVIDNPTDTTIYSLKKMVQLLCQCNPNCIEILGCKPEHYLILDKYGKMLLDNKEKFLSKRCINTFRKSVRVIRICSSKLFVVERV